MTDRPATLIDPVCGMTVNVASAEAAGLLLDHEGRTYGFCRNGCRRAFAEEPATYVAAAEARATAEARAAAEPDDHPAGHAAPGHAPLPVIDTGMRLWYDACACCLGDTYPEIRAQLDAERTAAEGLVDPPVGETAGAAS